MVYDKASLLLNCMNFVLINFHKFGAYELYFPLAEDQKKYKMFTNTLGSGSLGSLGSGFNQSYITFTLRSFSVVRPLLYTMLG